MEAHLNASTAEDAVAVIEALGAEIAQLQNRLSDVTRAHDESEHLLREWIKRSIAQDAYAGRLRELLEDARGDVAHQAEISGHAESLLERIDEALAEQSAKDGSTPTPPDRVSP